MKPVNTLNIMKTKKRRFNAHIYMFHAMLYAIVVSLFHVINYTLPIPQLVTWADARSV